MSEVERVGTQTIWMIFGSLGFIVCLMFVMLWVGWWITRTRGAVSPYTRRELMLGVDFPKSLTRQVEEFLKGLPQPENGPFDINYAAICRDTKRIFPNAVTRGEVIRLNWDFLDKRYRGNWVSWGSLSEMQQGMIKLHHRSVEGFQLEKSCPNRKPEDIESWYAILRPGPLYVDVATKILLGWQRVPGTDFEVLVVKKPDYDSIDEVL